MKLDSNKHLYISYKFHQQYDIIQSASITRTWGTRQTSWHLVNEHWKEISKYTYLSTSILLHSLNACTLYRVYKYIFRMKNCLSCMSVRWEMCQQISIIIRWRTFVIWPNWCCRRRHYFFFCFWQIFLLKQVSRLWFGI